MEVTIRMSEEDINLLIRILEEWEGRCKALHKRSDSDTEKALLMDQMAVCQGAYLQLDGLMFYDDVEKVVGPLGIDWSKETLDKSS